jgi:hypothetical protein
MPNSATGPNEITSRIRVAWAYSGKAQDELSKELAGLTPIKAATWRGYFGKTRANGPSDPKVLDAVAKATGVPSWFMRNGWEGWRSEPPAVAHLQEIWLGLGELSSRIKRLEAAVPASGRQGAVTRADRDAALRQLADLVRSLPTAERPTILPVPEIDEDNE